MRFVVGTDRAILCAITHEALELLEGCDALSSAGCLNAYRRRRQWIRALAMSEIAEGASQIDGVLLLTAANVRFQLACDDTSDLPSILCV